MSTDPLSQFRLDGKVALVTGGSRGMGKEMVMAFARVAADVVIASRKIEGCEELAKQVHNETGQRALASHMKSSAPPCSWQVMLQVI